MAARERELQRQGVLDALYVPDGSGAPDRLWAVFDGETRDAVERIIERLPLYRYIQAA
jgi:muconolactone delta-isomerase